MRKFRTGFISHSGLKSEGNFCMLPGFFTPGGSCMTWISIQAPSTPSFWLLCSQSPQISKKKFPPLVCKWSLSWHISVTGLL